MTMIDLFTIIFVLVDDWYQKEGVKLLRGKPGAKPEFTDSEVITLMLAQEFIPFPSETQYIGFIRANYLALFPKLVDQSQFNRRARALRLLVEQLRRYWLVQKGWHLHTRYLLDTKPVPVLGYKRNKDRSDFAGSANFGRCASRNLKYFGYKLVTISTLNGIPIVYDLVPANTDERLAAEAVIDYFSFCDIFADKGFLGLKWQTSIFDQTNNLLWTPRRANQKVQNSPDLDRWLSKIRERIEGVFHEIQNTGRNIERFLAKTILGLTTRVIAKMTAHLLRHLLRIDFAVNVQTFEVASAS
ncbi:MAG: IS982 family transposase [Anaerolineaceae bacterium]|nr:IS982 family transposase [Anaerolineaceae bacterium]